MSTNLNLSEAVGLLKEYDSVEMADLMSACEIFGVPGNVHSCVVARWLTLITDEPIEVDGAVAYDHGEPTFLPDGVIEFIASFDAYDYPFLVEREGC